jgi:hypothetical protein
MVPELSDSGVPQREVDLLIGFYSEAARRLRGIVIKPAGITRASRAFKQARAAVLVAQVDRVLGELGDKSRKWVGANVPKAAAAGVKLADKQAVEAGVRGQKTEGRSQKSEGPIQGSFHLINTGTVSVFARDAAADLAKGTGAMGDTAKRVLRATAQMGLSEAEIDRVLAGGVITGQPVLAIRELREELRKVHGEQVSVKTKTGGVMTFDVGAYASLVARTKTRQSQEVARHERLEALDLDLVAIVGRVSKYFCSAFLGQVFSISGKSTKYPSLSSLPGGGPPFHPNCSKSTRPYVEALASPKQEDMAGGIDDAQKLLGDTPAEAQRKYQDLQLLQQVRSNYANTASRLFGKAA